MAEKRTTYKIQDLGGIGEVQIADEVVAIIAGDAVSERFAHFGFSINTWKTETSFIGRKDDLRFCKSLTVYSIEFVNDLFTLLEHWKLIFSNRNSSSTECSDICSLADRIAEESNRNACFEITHLDLRFNCRVTLYTCYSNKVRCNAAGNSQKEKSS